MATQTQSATDSDRTQLVEQKLQKLQELYADASEIGRAALEKGLENLRRGLLAQSAAQQGAGRIGARQGKVSELTLIANASPEGARRLRGLLETLDGNFQGAEAVGTVHDMRFVFLDNDTKVLFTTAYDGDWDPYIDDFVTKIPDALDLLFSNVDGWPGIHSPEIKEWIVAHQIPAASWYVANPDLTVAETRRLKRMGEAFDEFLDKIG